MQRLSLAVGRAWLAPFALTLTPFCAQVAAKKAEKKAKQVAQKAAAEEAAVQKAAEDEAARVDEEAKAAEAESSAPPASEEAPPAEEEKTWEDAAIAPAEPVVEKAEAAPVEAPKPPPAPEPKPAPVPEPDGEEDYVPVTTGERKEHDEREHLNLVFIGHVDAGKSTFCGQILFQTEQVRSPRPLPMALPAT
jgi:peptide chain release factor subunit 3